jgi:hypothetical protein
MGINFNWYYVVASKGIQDFILRGDKLRHMVGGSELVEQIPTVLIPNVLEKLAITEHKILSTAAGGARILFAKESDARRLAEVLPLAISLHAPGLEAVQALVELKGNLADAMETAEKMLQSRRNLIAVVYPPASPLAVRVPRTGQVAVDEIQKEAADAAMLVKEQAREAKILFKKLGISSELCPVDTEKLAGDNSYLAIFHADANGLGQAVMELLRGLNGPEAADKYVDFSKGVEKCALKALHAAVSNLKKPFRPLICAGDDVTLILNSYEAIEAAKRFLETFESESAKILGAPLTAAAGIAFIHTSFPFAQGYELCESLCKYAKTKTERKVSSLAFWRLTATLAGDVETNIDRELVNGDCVLTMMPYCVGTAPHTAPHLDELQKLIEAIPGMPSSRLRGLLTEMSISKASADADYNRLKDVMRDKPKALQKFALALNKITGGELWKNISGKFHTPLHDALELVVLGGKKQQEQRGEE